jgi:hypothetical protein
MRKRNVGLLLMRISILFAEIDNHFGNGVMNPI